MSDSARDLDQFYTNPEIARKCYNDFLEYLNLQKVSVKNYIFLEPSAGLGAFYNLLPEGRKIGIDLDPKLESIIEHDFLSWSVPNNNPMISIGNPPFGKNSNLAIKFFNKCALYSDWVGFILPKTFKKESVIRKLNQNMHLVHQIDIPENAFIFKNEPSNVPCVFQIWKREDFERGKALDFVTNDFYFTNRENADIAFQRVGLYAGKLKEREEFDKISDSSHFFIKFNKNIDKYKFYSLRWEDYKYNTAGNPSISKYDIFQNYKYMLDREQLKPLKLKNFNVENIDLNIENLVENFLEKIHKSNYEFYNKKVKSKKTKNVKNKKIIFSYKGFQSTLDK